MGAGDSKLLASFPPDWAELSASAKVAGAEAVCQLSALPLETFLDVEAPVPELEASSWDFLLHSSFATRMVELDSDLSRLVYRLVPKRVTEDEFWRLYFCHLHGVVVRMACMDGGLVRRPAKAGVQVAEFADLTDLARDLASDPALTELVDIQTTEALRLLEQRTERLSRGFKVAVDRGLLPAALPVETAIRFDVSSTAARLIPREVVAALGDIKRERLLIAIQGWGERVARTVLSGWRTTLPCCACLDVDSIFVALARLAAARCQAEGTVFDASALNADLAKELVQALHFGRFGGTFDVKLSGYGHTSMLSQAAELQRDASLVEGAHLMEQFAFGEVVRFIAQATKEVYEADFNFIIFGHATILDHLDTPHRFELTVGDHRCLGKQCVIDRLLTAAEGELEARAAVKAEFERLKPPPQVQPIVNEVTEPAETEESAGPAEPTEVTQTGTEASFAMTFGLADGSNRHVVITQKPLGMMFSSTVPFTVTQVKPGGHAEHLGIEVGWTILVAGGENVSHTDAASLQEYFIESTRHLKSSE